MSHKEDELAELLTGMQAIFALEILTFFEERSPGICSPLTELAELLGVLLCISGSCSCKAWVLLERVKV